MTDIADARGKSLAIVVLMSSPPDSCAAAWLQAELRLQNFKRLPIPDSRDAAIGHGLGQCDAALVSRVAKAATNHRVAKTKHQGPTIIVDAVAERIIFDAKFDEPIVIGAQKVQFDLAPE